MAIDKVTRVSEVVWFSREIFLSNIRGNTLGKAELKYALEISFEIAEIWAERKDEMYEKAIREVEAETERNL